MCARLNAEERRKPHQLNGHFVLVRRAVKHTHSAVRIVARRLAGFAPRPHEHAPRRAGACAELHRLTGA